MTARHLRYGLCFLFCVVLAAPGAFAQGTPLALGPLTVTVPAGWTGQTNTVPVRLFSPDSTPQGYFSVEFFPFEQTPQDLREHHSQIWTRVATLGPPTGQPQSGVLGQFIWTKVEVQSTGGQRGALMLYSAKSGSTYIGIGVEATRSDIASRNLSAFEAMLRGAKFSEASQPPASSVAPSGDSGNAVAPQANAAGPASLADYIFTTPPGWTATQYSDAIVLMSPASVTNEKCVVTLFPMRTPSTNLLADAYAAFQDVFKNFRLTNQTVRNTPMPQSVVRGTSGQGWDYVAIRKGVAPPNSPESRVGLVFVARLNNRLAVISGVSRDPLISTCFGELVGNAWPRFFYSLSFKGWTPTDQSVAMRKKMAGTWTAATGSAADQFTFAANGRYGGASAEQHYNVAGNDVVRTTNAFFGNGAYTLKGNTITLKDDRKSSPDTGYIRVEDESKDDGRTWAEILYLLRVSAIDGKDYEVRYEKK